MDRLREGFVSSRSTGESFFVIAGGVTGRKYRDSPSMFDVDGGVHRRTRNIGRFIGTWAVGDELPS